MIQFTSDFLSETTREWSNGFKVLKERGKKKIVLPDSKPSKIKTCSDKGKAREVLVTKHAKGNSAD